MPYQLSDTVSEVPPVALQATEVSIVLTVLLGVSIRSQAK